MDRDRLSGAFLFLVGLYVAYEAHKLPFGHLNRPDSGFFPVLIALSLLSFSGISLLRTFTKKHVREPVVFEAGNHRILIAWVGLVLYATVLNQVGYVIASLLVMILVLKVLEGVGWWTTCLVALPAVGISYAMFKWLGVPLPAGIIPF